MRRLACPLIVLGIVSALAGLSARAGELRVLDYDGTMSTSRCIGDPKTPLCAVETLEACLIRPEWELCETVGFDDEKYKVLKDRIADDYLRLYLHRYREISRRVIAEKDLPFQAKARNGKRWKVGDLALLFHWQGCRPDDICVKATRRDPKRKYGEGCRGFERCRAASNPRTYVVRRARDGHWHMVAVYSDPVFPESFWKRK